MTGEGATILLFAVVAGLLCALLIVQVGLVAGFARRFRRSVDGQEGSWPRVTILMPLRGADPQLGETLRRLTDQDYPDYHLQVVVDCEQDPAWEVANQALKRLGVSHASVGVIQQRRATCGLQCSALIDGARRIDDATGVVVIVDGDLIAHRTMLRELVTPLRDDSIGLSFGNRWFMPVRSTWGSLVRYCWNTAAVVPMDVLAIPWGGCMAIRRDLLLDTGLLDQWARAMVHDAPIKKTLEQRGYRAVFVPSLMMAIRESCDLAFALDFIKRQMTWTRLYHPNWWLVVTQAITTTLVPVLGIVTAAWLAVRGDGVTGAVLLGVVVAYELGLLALMGWMESVVRRAFIWRDEGTAWIGLSTLMRFPLAIVLTQAVYAWATVLASFKRSVVWRGVTYRMHSPWNVEKLDDQPFQVSDKQAGDVSL